MNMLFYGIIPVIVPFVLATPEYSAAGKIETRPISTQSNGVGVGHAAFAADRIKAGTWDSLIAQVQKLHSTVTPGPGNGVTARRLDRLEGRINRLTAEPSPDDGVVLKKDITQAETLVEAWSQFDAGNAKAAEALCKKALNENSADPDAPELLGLIAMTKKDWVGAEGHIHRSLNARMDARRAENPDVAVSMAHLGHTRSRVGDISGAQGLFERAIDIFDASIGPDDTEVLLALEPMSQMSIFLWKYTGTDPTAENLRLHPMAAEKILWLAGRFHQRRDFARAEVLLKTLLPEENPLVPSGPNVDAHAVADLLNLYMDMDARTTVREHIYSLYPIPGMLPTETRMRFARVLHRYIDWAGYPDNDDGWKRIDAILKHIHDVYLGAGISGEHPDMVTIYRNLAYAASNLQRYAESDNMHRRYIAGLKKIRRPNHPDIIEGIWMHARMCATAKWYDQAEHMLNESVLLNENMLGNSDPWLYSKWGDIGHVQYARGLLSQAESSFRKALSICEHSQGAMHPHTAELLHNLARVCEGQKKYDEAKALFARVAAIRDTGTAKPVDEDISKRKTVEDE